MVSNFEHYRGTNPETKKADWKTQRLVQPGTRFVFINSINLSLPGYGNLQPHGVIIECSSDDTRTLVGVTPLSNLVRGKINGEAVYAVKSVELVRITGELTQGQSKGFDIVPENAPPHSPLVVARVTHE